MSESETSYSVFSGVSKYRFRRVLYIALFWTVIDIIVSLLNLNRTPQGPLSLLVRSCLVLLMSLVMGYLFVFALRGIFKYRSLWVNFLAKTFILLFAALIMTFLVKFVDNKFIQGFSTKDSFNIFFNETFRANWLLKRTLYWIVLFAVTQLYIEINDKYSPGVFVDILSGKYMKPKIENRIVMFLDL